MKKLIPFFIALFFGSLLNAQTIVPGGTVSGTWTIAGSPYQVQGNLLVPNGTTLTIQPGVAVIFQGSYKMLVSGRLLAVGTAADSIRFTSLNTETGWQGIRFESTPASNDTSRISYCAVKYANVLMTNGAGIFVNNFSKISIRHSAFTNCLSNGGYGGAIYLSSSNAVVADNIIAYNHSVAGAVCVFGGSPVITNNIVSNNDNILPPVVGPDPGSDPDAFGAGISCYGGSAIITSNQILYNSTKTKGGGIYITGGGSLVKNNTISYNTSNSNGGGIYAEGNPEISDNTISNNQSLLSGGGIYYEISGSPLINHNIVSNNTAVSSGGGMACYGWSALITNNLFSNNLVSAGSNYFDGGGGICFISVSVSTIVSNNVLSNNTAPNGGAILCYGSSPQLSSNTISNNSAVNGGALNCVQGSPTLLNSILWGNSATGEGNSVYLFDDISDPAVTYSDIAGGDAAFAANGNFYTGTYENNINTDPLFVTPSAGTGVLFDAGLANWGLQTGSPCINTGKPGISYPAKDFAGNVRVVSNIIDIGAIENQNGTPPSATISGGGQACFGSVMPAVVFNFVNGTFPLTLQYSLNGVPQTAVTGITTFQYTLTNPLPGNYAIVSISDAISVGTSSGTASVIAVRPVAGYTANSNRQCLQGNSFVFTNTSLINSGSLSYSWDFGDGTPLLTSANVTHTYPTTGTFQVRLIALGAAGCADTVKTQVTVTALSINTLQDTVKTFLDSVVLNGGAGFVTYRWNTGDTTRTITVKQPGWYILTVTNNDGCAAKDSSYVNFRKNKTLLLDKISNVCSAGFDLSVRTKNITNVIGLQGTISWDTTLMKFNSVVLENAVVNITASDLNTSNAANGYLTYSWFDNSLTGKSTADSTKIFTIRFNKNRVSAAVTSPVTFNSSHTALEIDSVNLVTGTPATVTETAYVNGAVTFTAPAAAVFVSLQACDSVVYNNRAYYNSIQFIDTVKRIPGGCDSLYKTVNIVVYTAVSPSVSIVSSQTDILYGTSVTFTAIPVFGGNSPIFSWYKNGFLMSAGTLPTYTTMTLNTGDTIRVTMTSSFSCALVQQVFSNKLSPLVRYLTYGYVKNPSGIVVPNVLINYSGFSNFSGSGGTTGFYYTSLYGGHDYKIWASKTNDINKTNGVSTLDVAIIQSHILNAGLLTSPYQFIAADVNRSNTISSLDILYIKRLILGQTDTFPRGSLWAFVDTSAGNFDPLHPLPYKDSFSYRNLMNNQIDKNFVGVKLGDVNFDWNPALLRPAQPSARPVNFYYNDVSAKDGQEIRIPIRVKNFNNLLGIQFTLNFNSAVFQFKRIEDNRLHIEYADNRKTQGKLSFIWNDAANSLGTLADGEILMTLVFDKKDNFIEEELTVTSDITTAEAWDGAYQKHAVLKSEGKIKMAAAASAAGDNWTVNPTLTTGNIRVQFHAAGTKHTLIQLLNADGKILLNQPAELPAGNSSVAINLQSKQALSSGIYYLKVSGMEGIAVKKIVLMKK